MDTNLLTLLVLFQDGQASFIPSLEMCILVSDDDVALGSIALSFILLKGRESEMKRLM